MRRAVISKEGDEPIMSIPSKGRAAGNEVNCNREDILNREYFPGRKHC